MPKLRLLSVSNRENNKARNEAFHGSCENDCMCDNKVLYNGVNPMYSKIDIQDKSTVGPVLTLSYSCDCRSDKKKNHWHEEKPNKKDESFTFNSRSSRFDCPENYCLNGGRCLPTHEGFR